MATRAVETAVRVDRKGLRLPHFPKHLEEGMYAKVKLDLKTMRMTLVFKRKPNRQAWRVWRDSKGHLRVSAQAVPPTVRPGRYRAVFYPDLEVLVIDFGKPWKV